MRKGFGVWAGIFIICSLIWMYSDFFLIVVMFVVKVFRMLVVRRRVSCEIFFRFVMEFESIVALFVRFRNRLLMIFLLKVGG